MSTNIPDWRTDPELQNAERAAQEVTQLLPAAQTALDKARRVLETAEQQVAELELRARIGKATEKDVATARTGRDQARTGLAVAQDHHREAVAQQARLTEMLAPIREQARAKVAMLLRAQHAVLVADAVKKTREAAAAHGALAVLEDRICEIYPGRGADPYAAKYLDAYTGGRPGFGRFALSELLPVSFFRQIAGRSPGNEIPGSTYTLWCHGLREMGHTAPDD